MSSGVIHIHESYSGKPQGVDRPNSVIRGCKLLGERSRNAPPNDNEYPRSTREKALTLLEGASVYVNHPEQSKQEQTRRYEDKLGVLVNVRENGDGTYGDFKFNPKHPLIESVLWDAENNPRGLGFSINARGRSKRVNNRNLVEEIVSVSSVDLVSRPATTKGLFEGEQPTMTTLKQLLETLKDRPEAKTLREMADFAGLPDSAEMPAPSSASPDDAIKSGFKAAIHAVVDDDSMDMKAKLQKIKDILKAQEKLMGGGDKPKEGDGEKPAETPAKEGAKVAADPTAQQLQEQLKALQLKDRARDICVSLKIAEPPAILIESMIALGGEAKMRALAETHKPTATNAPGGKPRSVTPGSATQIKEGEKPNADPKAWGRSILE